MTLPHVRLSERSHDRAGIRRKDQTWLDQQWEDESTRVLVVSGNRIRRRDAQAVWVSPGQAPDGVRVLLGEWEDRAWFAVVVGPEHAESGGDWVTLREVLPYLADDTMTGAPLVLHALGIAEWLLVTRFCPRCGADLEPRAAGHELHCPSCGRTQFPRTDPAVIMLVLDGEPGSAEERCLLGRQSVWPQGRFSTLAGFYEPGESLEDSVRREVAEEVGVVIGEVEYFGNQPWPLPASLMIGMVGHALTSDIHVDEDEIEEAHWFTRADMAYQAEAGTLVLPGGVSISRSLIEHWYGGPLPGQW